MKNIPANQIELSIVTTVYNSEKIITHLVDQIKSNLDTLSISYEIILVDDGSEDNSLSAIESEAKKDNRIKSIILSKNFGQQISVSAGIDCAKGRYILIMDGDLQNPPEEIPNLYRKITEGFDIVYTRSVQKNNLIDSFTSFFFWKFLKKILKIDIVDSQLMMRIMTTEVASNFKKYSEKTRTIAAISHDIGMKKYILNVSNKKRVIGKSNYNTIKRFNLAIDVILDLSQNPLNFIFIIGFLGVLFSTFLLLFYVYSYFNGNIIPGFTTNVILIIFFGSFNLFFLGIISRYLSIIYIEVKRRPLYTIKKLINFNLDEKSKTVYNKEIKNIY
jgi:dolichol-phosphate mannosyltransferase